MRELRGRGSAAGTGRTTEMTERTESHFKASSVNFTVSVPAQHLLVLTVHFPVERKRQVPCQRNRVYRSPCPPGPCGFLLERCSFLSSHYSWHTLSVDFVCVQSLKDSSADPSNLPSNLPSEGHQQGERDSVTLLQHHGCCVLPSC